MATLQLYEYINATLKIQRYGYATLYHMSKMTGKTISWVISNHNFSGPIHFPISHHEIPCPFLDLLLTTWCFQVFQIQTRGHPKVQKKPTESAPYGKRRPQDRSQLFRITGQHHLTAVLHDQIRLEYPGDGNQGLRLGGLAGLIDEDVWEVIRREAGGHEPAGGHQRAHHNSVLHQLRAPRKKEMTVAIVAAFLQKTSSTTTSTGWTSTSVNVDALPPR